MREELVELYEFDFAYTTVLSVLQRLRARRQVSALAPGRAREHELERLTDLLFGGSRERLLTELLNDQRLSRRTLELLQASLTQRLRG